MARLRRLAVGIFFGLGCLLVACSVGAETPAVSPQRIQIGCFLPLDGVIVAETTAVTQLQAEGAAQTFYENQNGAVLPRVIDSAGKAIVAPPIVAQLVHVRASDYGSSGQGGAGGGDPMRGKTVWFLGYPIERAASWSPYREGMTAYIIIDGQTSVPILTCARPPA